MATIAILSDVHGNLHALEAVLGEVSDSGAASVVFAGDIVGYGALPAGCVEAVRGCGGNAVIGNHDLYTRYTGDDAGGDAGEAVWEGVLHAAREMCQEALDWVWDLPWCLGIEGGIVAHSELAAPEEWRYLRGQEEAAPTLKILRDKGLGIGFFGHTHRQDYFYEDGVGEIPEKVGERKIFIPEGAVCAVTVGSVGQPRDDDFDASWTLWDPVARTVEFRRTRYPAVEAARAILDAGLPEESALRLLDRGGRDALFYGGAGI